MNSIIRTTKINYSPEMIDAQSYDDDLEPYLTLFLKPLTKKKSEFSRHELEMMCRDPLHSPRLIRYLIDFVKEM